MPELPPEDKPAPPLGAPATTVGYPRQAPDRTKGNAIRTRVLGGCALILGLFVAGVEASYFVIPTHYRPRLYDLILIVLGLGLAVGGISIIKSAGRAH